MLSDEVIIEVCHRAPRTAERLKRIRGTEQLSAHDVGAVVAAVRAGLATAPADLPAAGRRTRRPSVETESVVDLMNAVLRLKSEESGIATQVIATRDDLMDFVAGKRGRLSHGWRYELVGSSLERLLAGETGLTVRDGRVELL